MTPAGETDAAIAAHKFHRECIQRWLTKSPTCPLCRAQVGDLQRQLEEDLLARPRGCERAGDGKMLRTNICWNTNVDYAIASTDPTSEETNRYIIRDLQRFDLLSVLRHGLKGPDGETFDLRDTSRRRRSTSKLASRWWNTGRICARTMSP